MNTADPRPLVTVEDPELSRWQSAVSSHLREKLAAAGEPCHPTAVRAHPMMQAVNEHVLAEQKGTQIPAPTADERAARAYHPYDAQRAFRQAFPERAHARAAGASAPPADTAALPADTAAPSSRSPADSNIGEWLRVAALNSILLVGKQTPQYNDCKGNMQYGVVSWALPDDATVIVIGDWGSGNDDAVAMLTDAIKNAGSRLAAILHLGDTYYSGQPQECKDNIQDPVAAAFEALKQPAVPMFWVPGNHEYYSMGPGFYQTLPKMNAGNAGATQVASYFCLRTKSGDWQILGMDTGQSDYVAGDGPFGSSVIKLRQSEIQWHQDKLSSFKGGTILLSHHQLFSPSAGVTAANDTPWINGALWNVFSPHFDDIALWLWGHEHNQQLFYPGMFGLAMGRLVGASAYEEATGDSGLTAKYPVVQLASDSSPLTSSAGYYDHGYAILSFHWSKAPTIKYYTFPSWGSKAPANPKGTVVATETLATPKQMGKTAWPPAANLLRYVPQGMSKSHKCRLSVSTTGKTGSWTVLDSGVQAVQDISADKLSFQMSNATSHYSLNITIQKPTAGASPTCNLLVDFTPPSKSSLPSLSLDSSSAAVKEGTQLTPGTTNVVSTFSVTGQGATVTVEAFGSSLTWDPGVMFTVQNADKTTLYFTVEDQSL